MYIYIIFFSMDIPKLLNPSPDSEEDSVEQNSNEQNITMDSNESSSTPAVTSTTADNNPTSNSDKSSSTPAVNPMQKFMNVFSIRKTYKKPYKRPSKRPTIERPSVPIPAPVPVPLAEGTTEYDKACVDSIFKQCNIYKKSKGWGLETEANISRCHARAQRDLLKTKLSDMEKTCQENDPAIAKTRNALAQADAYIKDADMQAVINDSNNPETFNSLLEPMSFASDIGGDE